MLVLPLIYVNIFIIFIALAFNYSITIALDSPLVKYYAVTIVNKQIEERRVRMTMKTKAAPRDRRHPLQTLMSILGDVAQATGIGIRFF